jgi:hypothetical protein
MAGRYLRIGWRSVRRTFVGVGSHRHSGGSGGRSATVDNRGWSLDEASGRRPSRSITTDDVFAALT